jgi:hypothetical protein
MENDVTLPPRWAQFLLRWFLTAEEEEAVFGDLLETYRDSIFPGRRRLRANLWFVRQVPFYALRVSSLNVRNGTLGGLALCVASIVFSILQYPGLLSDVGRQNGIVISCIGFLFYGYAALRWTRPMIADRALALHLGTRWGIARAALLTFSLYGSNLVGGAFMPFFMLLLIAAFPLPFIAGAHGAIKLNRLHAGVRVGFWSGLIGGLIGFLGLVALGYILAFFPGFPGAEIPSKTHVYTALEFQQLNVADVLDGAMGMFVFGGLICPLMGWVGGCAGLLLARTGRPPEG